MTKAADPTTTKKTLTEESGAGTPPQNTQKLNVGRELADTTWRIAVPVLVFAGAGILIDKTIGSKPWITLLGAMFGFYVAALLIKRQLMNGMNDMKNTEIKEKDKK